MNRERRRERDRAKGVITYHQKPSTLTPTHVALLLTSLEHAFTVGTKLPGVTFPIHVTVEFDGRKACGTIHPEGMQVAQAPAH